MNNLDMDVNVSKIMSKISANSSAVSSPLSIIRSNHIRKYKEEQFTPKNICLDDNIEWEMPAFVIVTDNTILGHSRIYSSIENKLKMDTPDTIDMMPVRPVAFSKREFSLAYEQRDVIINSISIKINRLSYAKMGDYCSMNYPKSVNKAYKQLILLWMKHIQEYPEYWDGFDTGYIKQLYNDELDNSTDFEDEYIYNIQ